MAHQQPNTTIAILGGDFAVVENVLALLLEGSAYNTKLLEASPPALADGVLDGVDPLLLSPDLCKSVHDTLLSVVRGNPKTVAMPVLTLFPMTLKETLSDPTGMCPGACALGHVPWPAPLDLGEPPEAIEAALKPAPSGEGVLFEVWQVP